MKKIAVFIINLRGGGAERIVSYLLNEGYKEFEFHLILFSKEMDYPLPQSKNIKKEVSGMKTDSGKKVVTTDRKDALGKKAGEAGYKSALRKKQEDKKRREDAEKGQGAFAKQTAKTGAKGVNFGGRAKGGLMKKK